MRNLQILDSSFNCWIVYLMPFDDKSNDKQIEECQQACIDNNIFGMGWTLENEIVYGTELNEDVKNTYIEKYNNKSEENHWGAEGAEESSCESYRNINVGDYVVMRLRNGHFYVGKVSEKAKYLYRAEVPFRFFSWGCSVEKWIDIEKQGGVGSVPSEIRGRFSQRIHKTIQRVGTDRQKFLIKRMYELLTAQESQIPVVEISANNLALSLDYRELEDLVAYHIFMDNKQQYMLLPSSGKTNEQKFEFRFVNVTDRDAKPLTCQVKNQPAEDLKLAQYKDDVNLYDKIYVFIGNWDSYKIKEKEEECQAYGLNNVQIIKPSELLRSAVDFFRENCYYRYSNLQYCSLEDMEEILVNVGYERCGKRFKKGYDKMFKHEKDSRWICFEEDVYYSVEFGAIIYNSSNTEAQKIINRLEKDLEIED